MLKVTSYRCFLEFHFLFWVQFALKQYGIKNKGSTYCRSLAISHHSHANAVATSPACQVLSLYYFYAPTLTRKNSKNTHRHKFCGVRNFPGCADFPRLMAVYTAVLPYVILSAIRT